VGSNPTPCTSELLNNISEVYFYSNPKNLRPILLVANIPNPAKIRGNRWGLLIKDIESTKKEIELNQNKIVYVSIV